MMFRCPTAAVAAGLLLALLTPVAAGPIADPILPGRLIVRLEPIADGLSAPNWGTYAPGLPPRLLFVTDQDGEIWEFDLQTGASRIYLDVRARLVSLSPFQDERGLLGVAFHPEFTRNGRLYTYTSEPAIGAADFPAVGATPDHHAVITEWRVPQPSNPLWVPDPASARVLLRVAEPQANHNGGALAFGPDGRLYIALGDGGSGNDQGPGHGTIGNGQDPSTVLGSILRIDPLGTNAANGQYGIPPDNPGVPAGAVEAGGTDGCLDGYCDEIFAYGFRNPFRFSFDSRSGTLVAADVGQNEIEEIDVVVKGGNYGWRLKEGSFCFNSGSVSPCQPGQVPDDLIDPVAEYDHDEGIAVIGGFVYRGSALPPLNGRYIFGDFAASFGGDGRLFVSAGGGIRELRIRGQDGLGLKLLGFGQDAAGELYVLANASGAPTGSSGVVLKIVSPLP